MEGENSKAVALEYIRRFNTGDIGYAHELLSDDLEWWVAGDLPFSGTITKPVFRKNNEMLVGLFKTFPKWVADSAIAEGDKAALICHSEGETKGGFQYRNKYHMLVTVRDGLIVRVEEYMDTKHCYDLLAAMEAETALEKSEN
ncbi:hypothetical protein Sphch_3310 [Sphingobium chlorophenolicum L-1]|uniref:SnoaL-like domain-containing protein n=1 Tax=Sphingobium chlorophenolicum L-1 TaxID=690566 RepID=F6F397_SPHCR|nr:nuclear transport factor 2 family protein [Sphingobium chlorophenolicum]AEG50909.1 hypothetical protein Sphch_3310 [Sphingobium chlorophenolicum L-1]